MNRINLLEKMKSHEFQLIYLRIQDIKFLGNMTTLDGSFGCSRLPVSHGDMDFIFLLEVMIIIEIIYEIIYQEE